jgi:hypothetical protein
MCTHKVESSKEIKLVYVYVILFRILRILLSHGHAVADGCQTTGHYGIIQVRNDTQWLCPPVAEPLVAGPLQ